MNQSTEQTDRTIIDAVASPRRSKVRLALNILAQLFLIAILAVIIFVMWLPAIVSKN